MPFLIQKKINTLHIEGIIFNDKILLKLRIYELLIRGEKAEPTKEQPMLFNDDDRKEIVKLQQELHEARKTLKVLKDAFELLGR